MSESGELGNSGQMQAVCPHCRQVLKFVDHPPAFCGFCGRPLAIASDCDDATQVYIEDTKTYVYARDDGGPGLAAAVADVVGDYKLGRELGQGGMGLVYEAEQAVTGRRVALKLLSPRLAHTEESLERFLREGRLAAAFSHPRSTFIFGAGQHAGRPYITMELMPGRTLSDVCREEGPLPVARAVDYILDVVEGLEAAHAAGIIHRDVKPSNCFLDRDGRVKVGDFGLSKSLVNDAELTRTGTFLGTPLFAAPEQVRAGPIDARTDVYAVGATLFYLLAGRGPFIGDPAAVIAQIASDPAPRLRSLVPGVPRDLDQLVSRTLEKDPQRRVESLALVREALQPFATEGVIAAPVGRRAGAYFLDMLLTGVMFGIAVFVLVFIVIIVSLSAARAAGGQGPNSGSFPLSTPMIVVNAIAFALLVISYFAICEAWTGKSLGKRWLGLRVVGPDGGRPALGRAFLRASLVPGLMWMTLAALLPFQLPSDLAKPETNVEQGRELVQQLMSHVAIIPMLAFLLTMRARNGYAGLHDLASGTRVVATRSPSSTARWGRAPRVVPSAVDGQPGTYGPFRAMGLLGRTRDGDTILQARDEALHRLVWVVVHPAGQSGGNSQVAAARADVARFTRPRWLQSGTAGPSRWDAFEAVVGAPLSVACSQPDSGAWERGRFLLRELAGELQAASADGTLPAMLALDCVWIDREGHVKLLDAAFEAPVAIGRQGAPAATASLSPVGLLRAAVPLFSEPAAEAQELPVHAREFVGELASRPDDHQTLVWAVDRLHELVSRPASLTWTDRLVSVGVSTGTEHAFYEVPLCLLLLAMLKLSGTTEPVRLATVFSFAFAMPIVVGFVTHGGPVFRLMGIDVRRSNGQPASRLRCAWRNFIVWIPLILSYCVTLAVLPGLVRGGVSEGSATAWALGGLSEGWRALVIALVALVPGLVTAMHAACACYAIARPQRGLQDHLAGTRLAAR